MYRTSESVGNYQITHFNTAVLCSSNRRNSHYYLHPVSNFYRKKQWKQHLIFVISLPRNDEVTSSNGGNWACSKVYFTSFSL